MLSLLTGKHAGQPRCERTEVSVFFLKQGWVSSRLSSQTASTTPKLSLGVPTGCPFRLLEFKFSEPKCIHLSLKLFILLCSPLSKWSYCTNLVVLLPIITLTSTHSLSYQCLYLITLCWVHLLLFVPLLSFSSLARHSSLTGTLSTFISNPVSGGLSAFTSRS